MASYYKYILDNGHGGLINGVYQTKGKRSFTFPDGTVLYEGEFNRDVVNRIASKLRALDIDNVRLVNTQEDTPLRTRTSKANKLHKADPRTVMISVHANAHGTSWNGANGIDSFYFEKGGRASTSGKKLAQIFQKRLIEFTGRRDRGIKGRNFHMLRETAMPSVLLECGFMTNLKEATLLKSDDYREKIANAIVRGVRDLEFKKRL